MRDSWINEFLISCCSPRPDDEVTLGLGLLHTYFLINYEMLIHSFFIQ